MSNPRPILSDAVLRDALRTRVEGPDLAADLLDDVLLVVRSTSQDKGWGLPAAPAGRPLVLLAAAALLLAATIGLALSAGARFRIATPNMRLTTPVTPLGDGDIVFVQARYAWDGSKDSYGAATPTVEGPQILRVPSAGGDPTLLASVPASVRRTLSGSSTVGPAVRVSPDGSRIAFRLLLDAPGIYVMNRDGSELTRITDLPEPFWFWGQATGRDFAWSPDGTRIAFTSPMGTGAPGGDKAGSLYVVDVRDGRLTKLSGRTATGGVFPPIAWSPDGSRIAFARSRGPLRSSTNSLVVMDADGSDEALLLEIYDVDLGPLTWSPDGSRIAFMRGSQTDGNEDGAGGLWVVNPDGTDPQQITTEQFSTEVQAVLDMPLAWSPDGRWIAWLGGRGTGVIRLIASDRSGERVIGRRGLDIDDVYDVAWSPDGSQLVFSDSGRAVAESPPTWDPPSIYVIGADGTGQRWLADGEYPDWSR